MKKMIFVLVTLVSMLFSMTCHAGIQDYPRVAVVSMENRAARAIPNSLMPRDLSLAADLLTDELVACGMFDVVERMELSKVIDEQALGNTGIIDTATATKMGKLLGVEYIIVGSINNLSSARSHAGVGYSGAAAVSSGKNSVTCNVSCRFIEVETGRVVLGGRGMGKSSNTGFDLAIATKRNKAHHYRNLGVATVTLGHDSVTGQMVYNAIDKAVLDMVEGKQMGLVHRMNGTSKR